VELAASLFPLAEAPPLGWVYAVYQHAVNVVVDALVVRIDNVGEVRGLQQVAVAKYLGYQLFGLAEGSERVGVVADYQYWHASTVEGAIEGVGGELVVEQASAGERGVHQRQQWEHRLVDGVND